MRPDQDMQSEKEDKLIKMAQKMEMSRVTKKILATSFCASVISAVCGGVSKSSQLKGDEVNFCFGSVAVIYSLIALTLDKSSRDPQFSTWDVLKAVANGIVFNGCFWYFFFLTYDLLPYGDAMSIAYSTLFLGSILVEIVKMKRRPSWLTCLAGMFCMTGLVLFAQPHNLAKNKNVGWKILLGVLYSILSGLAGALFYLNLQGMKNCPVTVHWFAHSIGALTLPLGKFIFLSRSLSQCALSGKVILVSSCAVWPFMTLNSIVASQLSLPSVSFLLRLITIVLSYVMQLLLLNESSSLYSVLGVTCISMGVVIQTWALVTMKISKGTQEVIHMSSAGMSRTSVNVSLQEIPTKTRPAEIGKSLLCLNEILDSPNDVHSERYPENSTLAVCEVYES